MAVWRLAQLLSLALAAVQALELNNSTLSAGSIRRLAGSAPGNIAVCYTPFHNTDYPLFGGPVDAAKLRAAIENDFRLLSKHVTHVRTYYSMHYDIEVAPIAAQFGLKLYLGVFLTKESWGAVETNAAVNAIKKYSDTVEAVFVGNENLVDFKQRSGDILAKINEIKTKAGGDAGRVKYGTVQRITEYLDNRFDWDIQQLNNNLDILGVNIYPFFNNNYDGNRPTDLLDAQWKLITTKYPSDKIRLTETGFPTAGSAPNIAPRVFPSLDASFKYYEGVVNWNPSNYQGKPKFWFQAFDRRNGDPAGNPDYERFFGFFTTERNIKHANFPRLRDESGPVSPPPSSYCTVEDGVDYVGNDVGNAPANAVEDCFIKCNNYNGCGAFTWTPYNSGTCWFKSSRGATVANSEAKSAITCKCSVYGKEPNVDYIGNDISNVPSADPTANLCILQCASVPACHAYTWSDYNGGTCWLKSGKGATTVTTGVISGVMCV